MTDEDSAARFHAERARLTGLAYRMLGTPDDADDVVQEAWLRWSQVDPATIDEPAAWLTTVTTRLAIDRLTSARAHREVYTGPWLPEPDGRPFEDLSDRVVDRESVTLGFLRIMETLQPVERAVFLLHDVFHYPFDDIALTVDKSVTATRQIATRARTRVRDGRTRLDPEPEQVQVLAEAFLAAVLEGDVDRLAGLLTDDAVHISDGGADHHAARRPVVGADKVARLFVNLAKREVGPTVEVHWVRVNGELGLYLTRDGRPSMLGVFGWRDGRVAESLMIVNPDKLQGFHRAWATST